MWCLLFIVISTLVNAQTSLTTPQYNIKLGFLFSSGKKTDSLVGFAGSAGAVSLAVETAKKNNWLRNINVTFEWHFSNGFAWNASGFASDLIYRSRVHALFGPVSNSEQVPVNALASYYNVPQFIWGKPCPYAFKADLAKYNSTVAMSGTALGNILSVMHVCDEFQWTQISFISISSDETDQNLPYCDSISDAIDDTINTYSANITLVYRRDLATKTTENYRKVLRDMSEVSRIILLCADNDIQKRAFMLAASDEDMLGQDYVYILMQSDGGAYKTPMLWVGTDGRDDEAKKAFMSTLIIDKPTAVLSSEYNERVMELVKEYPWYCSGCSTDTGNASSLSYYLGDAVLTYLYALNRTIEMYKTQADVDAMVRNSTILLANMAETMANLEGDTTIMSSGRRSVDYALYGLDPDGSQNTWAFVASVSQQSNKFNLDLFTPNYTNAKTTIWANRKGYVPLNEPICGYLENRCPTSPVTIVLITVACVFLMISFLLLFIGCCMYFQRNQRRRLNALWQVDYHMLVKPDHKSEGMKSQRSLSTNSLSLITVEGNQFENVKLFYYQYELVVARKFDRFQFNPAIEAELREMRQLDHPQLNRFLGIAMYGQVGYKIYRYCERGTIESVLDEYQEKIDERIANSMIKNIVEGLFYIHNSHFGAMGCLNSDACVVDDRFQVKLQYYGLHIIKEHQTVALDNKKALYLAPELLRQTPITLAGTLPGDIYSLSIILTQIVTRRSVWSISEENLAIDMITRRIIKRTEPLERPSLHYDSTVYVDPTLLTIIQNSMAEEPEQRPDIKYIRGVMKTLENGRKSNLMDYMFALMEDTAMDLEQQVQQRTAELIDEQRKANLLLYRMMPAEAVDVLRRGESVEPELYEAATVFFSDIVGFTVLSSKSTPLQIIAFLNQVYTVTDDVIEQHDVYKVETIGDGLHCVSGVPIRNGNNHVKEICDMALTLQKAVKLLYLPHLPNEKIEMRFGVHSGPCVTGIVGMTAPRYCVFGDTVSLAAKMESTSKPGQIHVSPVTKALLDKHFHSTYNLVDRGEIIVKGRDPMNTHWLMPIGQTVNF
ncbi:unnamed protein product [Bursaphelenchus okinawaensis]|uniref:guanylate cyclase n=1 Tax=Bursaphelenchus okinawaensis TaxID=465554 RepID=A0A811LD22_9BILA|nr:unnamed protein product [Bursaphelenchus okinawaensis]CAG9120931.1 unnamed protein product [Bursaphelenchus okinawaensis]